MRPPAPQEGTESTATAARRSLGDRLLSGAAALTVGQVASQAAQFARNVVIVRAMTKADYGIAATFTLAMRFVEMTADMNIERLLVQAEDGDDPRFQSTGQLIRFAQGLLVALTLFLLAPAIAELFSLPDLVWAYRALALAPLINAFTHFDMNRFQRKLAYRPMVRVQAGSQIFTLLAVLGLSQVIRDPTLMLWTVLIQMGATATLTHLVAQRPYRWSFDAAFFKRALAFGWPLTLNGFLLYVMHQGDKMVIGSAATLVATASGWATGLVENVRVYDMGDLAVYTLAMSLTLMPCQLLNRTLGVLFFPVLSRAQSDDRQFHEYYAVGVSVFSLAATLLATMFVLAGTAATVLIYREEYRAVSGFIGVLGAMQGVRFLRLAVSSAALAKADTKILLYANVGRTTAIVAVIWAALLGVDLFWIALAGLLAETLAGVVSVVLMQTRYGLPARLIMKPALFAGVGIGGAFALESAGLGLGDWGSIGLAFAYAGLVAVAGRLAFPRLLPFLRMSLAARKERKAEAPAPMETQEITGEVD